MRESVEFRVKEEHAHLLFSPDEGTRVTEFTRKVEVPTTDPRFSRVGEIQQLFRSKGKLFFAGWEFRRRYGQSEISSTSWFSVQGRYFFEPSGEECGTVYDESSGCPHCGSGGTLIPPLRLKTSRISRRKDFATSIAGERVASERAVELFQKEGIKGLAYAPVQPVKSSAPSWFHITVTAPPVDVVDPTRWGIHPFDVDDRGEYRCPQGHHPGLTVLSEIFFEGGWGDALLTRQFKGARRGLLRPSQLLLVSKRLHDLIRTHRLVGWGFEVAHHSVQH